MKIYGIIFIIGVLLGGFIGYKIVPHPAGVPVAEKEQKCKASVVRITKPDGSVQETIEAEADIKPQNNPVIVDKKSFLSLGPYIDHNSYGASINTHFDKLDLGPFEIDDVDISVDSDFNKEYRGSIRKTLLRW